MRTVNFNSVIPLTVLTGMLCLASAQGYSKSMDDSSFSSHQASKSADSINRTLDTMVEKYRAAIEELESQEGAYSGRLSQELANLGDIYQRYGKHQQAVDAFKRSLHLSRINDGLYSVSQIPIVEKSITSLKALHKWDLVSDRYAYLYWLYTRNFKADDVQMLGIYNKLAKWSLQSYAMQYSEFPAVDLVNADALLRRSEQLVANKFGENDEKMIDVLNHRMIANYFVATYGPIVYTDNRINNPGYMPLNPSEATISFLQNKSFSTGNEILQREIDVYEHQQPVKPTNIAKAKLKIADWSLLFDKRRAAMELYQQAYAYSVEHELSNNLIQQLFGHPVALPDLPNLESNVRAGENDEKISEGVPYVLASVDVTRNGQAKNITIVDANPEDNVLMRSKVLKSLRLAKFRPRIEDGNPIFTKEVQLHIFPHN